MQTRCPKLTDCVIQSDIKHVLEPFGDLSLFYLLPEDLRSADQRESTSCIRIDPGLLRRVVGSGRRVVAAQLARLIGLTVKPSRDIDLEIGGGGESDGAALLSLA